MPAMSINRLVTRRNNAKRNQQQRSPRLFTGHNINDCFPIRKGFKVVKTAQQLAVGTVLVRRETMAAKTPKAVLFRRFLDNGMVMFYDVTTGKTDIDECRWFAVSKAAV